MFKAKVIIKRRKSILDPQGKAAEQGAQLLGFKNIRQVRINKEVEFFVNLDSREEAVKEVTEFSEKLLANPIMEDFEILLEEVNEA
ncbi:MAG: phosphoribosylformylglycinamidine synthase subunit PurS [Ignavibacteriaceae bacterium]|nr:MAG: phosphoribosylformylglycinamidine synthase subunit PurS [Ignavibacteriaceae bacterium]